MLFGLGDERRSPPAPRRVQYHSPAPDDRTEGNAQHTRPRFTRSTQSRATAKADAGIGASSHEPRPPGSLYVEVRRGAVTLRADNHPLKQVLAALAQESGIPINTHLIADRPLSLQLNHVPLAHALQVILAFEDSFFAFENRGEATAALKAVWAVPVGTGGTWQPQTAVCMRELSELAQQLTAEQASQRAEAIEALIELQGPDAAETVVQALRDHDEAVRYRALLKAQVAGLALPPEVLANLVQHDGSELVRMMALEAIGTHPAIEEQDKVAVAQDAINDVSPAVQTRAGEIFSHLEAIPLVREQEQELYDEVYQELSDEFPDKYIDTPEGEPLL